MAPFNLLPEQRAVVEARQGYVYAVAAAGSGKTTTALHRALALGDLHRQVILTYNKSASVEVYQRLKAMTGYADHQLPEVATVHSWCWQRVRRIHPTSPLVRPGRIIGTPGGPSGPEIMGKAFKLAKWQGNDVVAAHDAYGVVREAVAAGADFTDALRRALQTPEISSGAAAAFFELFGAYERVKHSAQAVDFCDMAVWLLAEVKHRGVEWAGAYLFPGALHVVMDETQDANEIRWEIFDLIGRACVSRGGSALAVGDPRQAIYGFTGARPDLFEARLRATDAQTIHMPVTLRSTHAVTRAGNELAREWGYVDSRPRDDAPEGVPVVAWSAATIPAEVEGLVELLKGIYPRGCGPDALAVLGRTNAHLAHVECGLHLRGVGVQRLDGKDSVWDTAQGQHLLAYLRAHEAQGVDFRTIDVCNKPLRYVNRKELGDAVKAAGGLLLLHDALPWMASKGLRMLRQDLVALSSAPWPQACTIACNWLVRHAESASSRGQLDAEDQVEMYRALTEELKQAGSTEAVISSRENAPRPLHKVTLGTVHKAKGLEWSTVVGVGIEQGIVPHKKAMDVQEERRLLYVLVTRAKDRCALLGSSTKRSSFLASMPSVVGVKKIEDIVRKWQEVTT